MLRDTEPTTRYLAGMKQVPPFVCLILIVAFLPACQSREDVVFVSAEADAIKLPIDAVSKSTRSAATALLNSLDEKQKKQALYDIKAPLRKDWHYIPPDRQGLKLGDMTNEQKTLVHQLMQTALSDSGYLKATDIIWLESVLYEMSNQNPGRDPGKYVLQIFGDPTDETAAWGWRLEGHHLSINLTYTPEGIGVTPLFFGTNPAVVQQGPLAGKRILADAHNLAIELAKSMNDEQRKKMMLGKKPRDVITGPGREQLGTPKLGLSWGDFTVDQRYALTELIANHFDNYQIGHHKSIVQRWSERQPQTDAPAALSFSWAGPIDADKPFYYRIHMLDFVIEYSCQGKNHVHCVIHDLTDPLQEDLLKKHFEQHAHDAE